MLNTFRQIPQNSIFIFINEEDKEFYMGHSISSIIEISKNANDLALGVHKSKELQKAYNDNKLELRILQSFEDNTPQFVIRSHYSKVCSDLETRGYSNLRADYNAGEVRLKTEVLYMPGDRTPKLFVIAVSKRKERFVLAIFENMIDGKAWVEKSFPGGDKEPIIPIFHDNDITRSYHEQHGYKLNI